MSYTPEKNKAYLRDRYAKQREDFYAYLGGQCVVCFTKSNLHIDHIDWCQKSFNVGILWGKKSLPKVYEELNKCQLLCERHHTQKTAGDNIEICALRESFVHGTQYAWQKKKCRCEVCKPVWRAWHDDRNAKRRK